VAATGLAGVDRRTRGGAQFIGELQEALTASE
jgi:hypothetical protein